MRCVHAGCLEVRGAGIHDDPNLRPLGAAIFRLCPGADNNSLGALGVSLMRVPEFRGCFVLVSGQQLFCCHLCAVKILRIQWCGAVKMQACQCAKV